MLRLNISAKSKGTVFSSHEIDKAMGAFILAAKEDVAIEGVNIIQRELDSVLKNQTPYYKTQIQVDRTTEDFAVTDGGVIYGPWLEGVGSRNATTRFKGYSTFRRMRQVIDATAGSIVDKTWQRFKGRFN